MSWYLEFGCGHGDLVTVHHNLVLFVGLFDRTLGGKHSPTIESLEIPSSGLQGDGSTAFVGFLLSKGVASSSAGNRGSSSKEHLVPGESLLLHSDQNLGAQAGAME